MRDWIRRFLDIMIALLAWFNRNRPEFCWAKVVGYLDMIDDDYTYSVKFYGLRLRAGAKWGLGFTRLAVLSDQEEEHYMMVVFGDGPELECEIDLDDEDGDETTVYTEDDLEAMASSDRLIAADPYETETDPSTDRTD